MPTIEVHLVHALTDGDAGGNPAGVVLDADPLAPAQKLAIAQRVGLSETAFVSRSQIATVKLEFFTPARQIAHCGHATIAAFSLLRARGVVGDGQLSKETIDGTRNIAISDGAVFMEQRAPRYTDIDSDASMLARVAQSLGVAASQVGTLAAPTVVDTGNRFLMIALPDERSLRELRPDMTAIEAVSEALDLIGYYAFSTQTRRAGRHAGARMFAPRFGIEEESATGTAAGPLACFLHDRMDIAARMLLIEQGRLMAPPSPSLIRVTLEAGTNGISGLMAGGTARIGDTMLVDL
jgi:PhzF family phenazine biosynthesis protein